MQDPGVYLELIKAVQVHHLYYPFKIMKMHVKYFELVEHVVCTCLHGHHNAYSYLINKVDLHPRMHVN